MPVSLMTRTKVRVKDGIEVGDAQAAHHRAAPQPPLQPEQLKQPAPRLVRGRSKSRSRGRSRGRGRGRGRSRGRSRGRGRVRVRIRVVIARPAHLVAHDVDDLHQALVEVFGYRIVRVPTIVILLGAPLEPQK